jgi:hypothetical protein
VPWDGGGVEAFFFGALAFDDDEPEDRELLALLEPELDRELECEDDVIATVAAF